MDILTKPIQRAKLKENMCGSIEVLNDYDYEKEAQKSTGVSGRK